MSTIMRFTDLVNEHYADLNETELLMCNYIMENIDIIPTMSTLVTARLYCAVIAK